MTRTVSPRPSAVSRTSSGDAPGASRSSISGSPRPRALAVSRARSKGLDTIASGSRSSSRRRRPSMRACLRPRGVSARSASGLPGAASAWRTITSRIAGQDKAASPRTALCLTATVSRHRYVVVDVFTDEPLAGNQLAVFTDAREIPEAQLQRLAREMNLSETTFVYPPAADGHVRMRIFTPATELPFAGHPTLGTAFVLAAPLQLGEIKLETGMGVVPVRLEREGPRISFGWMSQPIPTVEPHEAADELLAALGVERSELPVELYDNGL